MVLRDQILEVPNLGTTPIGPIWVQFGQNLAKIIDFGNPQG